MWAALQSRFGRLIGERWRIEIEHMSARRRASTVLGSDLRRGEYTFLDPYAAEDEAEFFAVATEDFFERPAELRAAHPRFAEGLSSIDLSSPDRLAVSTVEPGPLLYLDPETARLQTSSPIRILNHRVSFDSRR